MQTVIMAGGLGLRLRPLTNDIPKPMVSILGRPYLEYQIRYLRRFGFTDILILSGYLGYVIRDYFGDGKKYGVKIQYSEEPAPLGTGGGLRHAKDLLENEFMIVYGDSFLPIDLGQFAQDFKTAEKVGMVVVYDNSSEDTTVKSNVRLESDGLVVRYDKQAHDRSLSHVEAGISAFQKRVLTFFSNEPVVSLEEQIFPRLIHDRQLMGWPTSQRFYDIGRPERLQIIEAFFMSHPELFS
jgi:NDP-sugar pyrophosphorylase family protein